MSPEELEKLREKQERTYQLISVHYGGVGRNLIPKYMLNMDFKEEILPNDLKIRQEFGITKKQLRRMVQKKPSTLMWEREWKRNQSGIRALKQKFVEHMGLEQWEVNEMAYRYPPLLSLRREDIDNKYKEMIEFGLSRKQITQIFKKVPVIGSFDLKERLENIRFMFDLYIKMPHKDIVDVVDKFPYIIA